MLARGSRPGLHAADGRLPPVGERHHVACGSHRHVHTSWPSRRRHCWSLAKLTPNTDMGAGRLPPADGLVQTTIRSEANKLPRSHALAPNLAEVRLPPDEGIATETG